MIFFIIALTSSTMLVAQDNNSFCLFNILHARTISQEDFLACKNALSQKQTGTPGIFTMLFEALHESRFQDFIDPMDHTGFLSPDFNKYDFTFGPEEVHRYRAIRDILIFQLRRHQVNTDQIISIFKQNEKASAIRLVLRYYKDDTAAYLEFVEQHFLKNANRFKPTIEKSIRHLAATILMQAKPKVYINKITTYFLTSHNTELYSLVHHIFTPRTLPFLSSKLRKKLIQSLFEQLNTKKAYYAYFDILAIQDLTKEKLIHIRPIQIGKPGSVEQYEAIRKEALRYYQEDYAE